MPYQCMDLITVAESRLSASRCVHSHFVIVSTFCQVTQLHFFLLNNFSLQTGYVKSLHANKEIFTVHYVSRDKHKDSSLRHLFLLVGLECREPKATSDYGLSVYILPFLEIHSLEFYDFFEQFR